MKKISRALWRWAEKDFGFRFRDGSAKRAAEYYQAASPDEFYHVPTGQRKLSSKRADELATQTVPPTSPTIVPNPWKDYGNPDYQQITTPEGDPCLNWAGCLSKDEIKLRETQGVSRAKEFVADLATREQPAPITLDLFIRVHTEIFGTIYPWAGKWRTVPLHKGAGPTRWPLPPFGIEPIIEQFANEVLTLTPFLSEDVGSVFAFAAQFMGDYLCIHPFREGNGRSAFILTELILLQNDLLPMDEFNRIRDQNRYFHACDAARLRRYDPLTALLIEWQAESQQSLKSRLSADATVG